MTGADEAGLQAALLSARLRLHDRGLVMSVLASVVVGTTLAVVLWRMGGWQPLVIAWWLGLVAALAVRGGVRWAWRRTGAAAGDRRWLWAHRAAFGLHGLVWAALALVVTPSQTPDGLQLVAFVSTAMAGGAMITGAFDLVAATAFVLPATVPLLLHLFLSPAAMASGLAVGTCVFLGIMLGAARSASGLFCDHVRAMLAERQQLAEARQNAADAESARRALADQHELLRQLIRGTHQGYWFIDPAGRTLEVNPAMCDLLGRARDELLGSSVFDAFAGPEREVLERELLLRRRGVTSRYEVDIVRPDGSRVNALNVATPIHDAAGGLVGSIGLWTDLSAQKSLERELRTYERVANSMADMVSVVDADRRYRLVNDAWCQHAGVPRERALGQPAQAHPLQLDPRAPLALVEDCFATGTVVSRTTTVPLDGALRRLQTTCFPYRDVEHGSEVRSVILVTRDVTEQDRITEHLRHREAELRALFEAFPGYITAVDVASRYVFMNRRAAALLGHEPEAVEGRRVSDVLGDARARVLAAESARALAGEVVRVDRHFPSPVGGPPRQLEITLLAGPPAPDGRQLLYSFGLDMTAHHDALAALAAARDEAERANQAKSRFLSHMSHELRTPLNAIMGFAQLLDRDGSTSLAARHAGWVQQILRGAQHLSQLIGELLDLGRIEAGQLALQAEAVPVAELFDECLAFVGGLAVSRSVRLLPTVCPGGPPAPTVLADRTRLKQVLLNLLANAIKYNHTGGEVQLRCRVDGEQVVLEVRDTGPGLSVEQQSRLFQPFERLGAERGVIEGSGIGLLLSRQLVEAMSGRIGLDSEVGRGSVFWLRLPGQARFQHASGADRAPAADTAAGAAVLMTVLYVDDNPVNLMLVQAMLDTVPGVRTLGCMRSPDALDLARRERPDLVLLDIHMPELNGHQVLALLRAEPLTAGVPVVAVSADADPKAIALARAGGFADYLTKPVDMPALLATLDRGRPR